MELHFILLLHNINRIVYTENTRLYTGTEKRQEDDGDDMSGNTERERTYGYRHTRPNSKS